MAISATHTRENQLAVKNALQERQRKETAQRRLQQEREAKEREVEKKLRIQRFEEEKRQTEKMARMEAELRAKELAREKKEEEQRNSLLYGRKKAAKMAASGSSPKYPQSAAAKDAATRKRLGDDLDDDDPTAHTLTREELRQKKREAELRRQLARATTKKSTTGRYRKEGHSLPGGAVNIVVNANGESVTPVSAVSSDPTGAKSLKERLTQGPNTLVLLQTKVRDRRTVDEAQQDIRLKLGKAPNKVLSGEEARTFDDWFGNSKDKDREKTPAKGSPSPCSASSTPAPSTSSISELRLMTGLGTWLIPEQSRTNSVRYYLQAFLNETHGLQSSSSNDIYRKVVFFTTCTEDVQDQQQANHVRLICVATVQLSESRFPKIETPSLLQPVRIPASSKEAA